MARGISRAQAHRLATSYHTYATAVAARLHYTATMGCTKAHAVAALQRCERRISAYARMMLEDQRETYVVLVNEQELQNAIEGRF